MPVAHPKRTVAECHGNARKADVDHWLATLSAESKRSLDTMQQAQELGHIGWTEKQINHHVNLMTAIEYIRARNLRDNWT